MLLILPVPATRVADLVVPAHLITWPSLPVRTRRDPSGNRCTGMVATGPTRRSAAAVVRSSGEPDPVEPGAPQHAVQELPCEAMPMPTGGDRCQTTRY